MMHICMLRWWTPNASSVSARDQSLPDSPPPLLKIKFRVNKNVCIKERGGGESGNDATVYIFKNLLMLLHVVVYHHVRDVTTVQL